MAGYFLVSYKMFLSIAAHHFWINLAVSWMGVWFVINISIFHLFIDWYLPIIVPVLVIQTGSFINTLLYFNSKFMSCLPTSKFDLVNTWLPSLQDVFHLSCKGWFLLNVASNGIFGGLEWVRIFHRLQTDPILTAIFPFDQELPASCSLFLILLSGLSSNESILFAVSVVKATHL